MQWAKHSTLNKPIHKEEMSATYSKYHWELHLILDPAEIDGPDDSSIKIIFQKIMLPEDCAFY